MEKIRVTFWKVTRRGDVSEPATMLITVAQLTDGYISAKVAGHLEGCDEARAACWESPHSASMMWAENGPAKQLRLSTLRRS